MTQYVYFARAGSDGPVKIGRSKDIRTRISSLQTGCPDKLAILGSIESVDAETLESEMHRKFDEFRIGRSEWFRWSKDISDEIANIGIHRDSTATSVDTAANSQSDDRDPTPRPADPWEALTTIVELIAERVAQKLSERATAPAATTAPQLLTPIEYAKRNAIGRRTVWSAIREGRLSVERFGRAIRIDPSAKILPRKPASEPAAGGGAPDSVESAALKIVRGRRR